MQGGLQFLHVFDLTVSPPLAVCVYVCVFSCILSTEILLILLAKRGHFPQCQTAA